jgi:hypothetical protein
MSRRSPRKARSIQISSREHEIASGALRAVQEGVLVKLSDPLTPVERLARAVEIVANSEGIEANVKVTDDWVTIELRAV